MKPLFELEHGNLYGMQLIGDNFPSDQLHCYCPIKVFNIDPFATFTNWYEITFHQYNYPQGVRLKTLTLIFLHQGERFILAESADHKPKRYFYFEPISKEWIQRHFGVYIEPEVTIDDWLKENA